ncbi:uncharacterized protein LOC103356748 [Stegastes partitus]|uniref:Uncharacterized LOC103356748 n=1 Tax=Stegastes partitus TaxID=144197 RepID=A0A3B5AER2_9TELE|nr:PREDICTED: uncharacterized protein LOC103356748 [Stegastes partitus]
MAMRATLTWLCSLAVLCCSAAQETGRDNCSSLTQVFHRLPADLKVAAECGQSPPSTWTPQQTASLLLYMRNVTDALHQHQLRECQGAEPTRCPEAEVPSNGGLACVTVGNKRYCKPLCNHGFDFGFLRRSRVFDECSEQTGYKWQTPYVGGNRLAVCNQALTQISGAKTAYFPKDQDCRSTKSSSQLTNSVIEALAAELKAQEINGEPQHACLVCG